MWRARIASIALLCTILCARATNLRSASRIHVHGFKDEPGEHGLDDSVFSQGSAELHEPALEKLHQEALSASALSNYEEQKAKKKGDGAEAKAEQAQEKKAEHVLEDIVGKIKSDGREPMTETEEDFTDLQEVLSEGDTAEMITAETAEENNALITANDLARVHADGSGKRLRGEDMNPKGKAESHVGDMALAQPRPDLLQMLASKVNGSVGGDGTSILTVAGYNRWKEGKVKYCFAQDVSEHVKHIMHAAINQYHTAVPCLEFVDVGYKSGTSTGPAEEQKCNEEPAIFVQSDPNQGCWSYLGMIPAWYYPHWKWGSQALQMQDPGCISIGTAVHEIGHAIGMAHEQSRPDRDDYVKLYWDNIQPGTEHNFKMDALGYAEIGYDILSVMHYDNYAFAKDTTKPTIEVKQHHGKDVGQRVGLSSHDVDQLAVMYKSEVSSCSANALAGLGCIDKPDDHGKNPCKGITKCDTMSAEHCCACDGGVKVQCYEGQDCPKVDPLPPPPPVDCIEDKTYLFHGYGYPCIYHNFCDFDVKFSCPSLPCAWTVGSKSYGAARCNSDWMTEICTDTSKCTVEKM